MPVGDIAQLSRSDRPGCLAYLAKAIPPRPIEKSAAVYTYEQDNEFVEERRYGGIIKGRAGRQGCSNRMLKTFPFIPCTSGRGTCTACGAAGCWPWDEAEASLNYLPWTMCTARSSTNAGSSTNALPSFTVML